MNAQLNLIRACSTSLQDAQIGKQTVQNPGLTGVFAMLLEAMTVATESAINPESMMANTKEDIAQPTKQATQDLDMPEDDEVQYIQGIPIIKYDPSFEYLAVEDQKAVETGRTPSVVNYRAVNNESPAVFVSGESAASQIVQLAEPVEAELAQAEPAEAESAARDAIIKPHDKEPVFAKALDLDTVQVSAARKHGKNQETAQKTSGDQPDHLQAITSGKHKTAVIPENQDALSNLPANKMVVYEQHLKEAAGGDSPPKSGEPVYLKAHELAEEFPRLIRTELSRYNAGNGDGEFVIQLEPRELGKLTVKLTSREGVISVKILVEQTETRTLIDNSLPNLKQSFAEQGIRFGRMDVEVSAQFSDHGSHQKNNWFNEQQKASRENWTRGQFYTESALDSTPALYPAEGRVDYLV